jgi:hypothetical protein
MNATHTSIKNWIYPTLIVVLVFAAWSGSWHAGLGKSDFAGHVGLMATLAEQIKEQATLHLWTSDWNSGASLVFWYIQPLFSSYLLLPFVEHWGLIDGLRIGDTLFLALAGLSMYHWCRHLTGSRTSALVGALVYALHPSVFIFVGEVGHMHQPVSMTIIPMVFLAWTRLAEDPNRANFSFATITSALLFYDMERFWLVLPHALILYGCISWQRAETGDRARALRTALGLGLLVGAGMSLLVAFPTLPALFERPLLQWHDSQSIDVFRQYYSFPHLLALVDRDGLLAAQLAGRIPQEFVSLPGQWYQGWVAMFLVGGGAILLARDRTKPEARGRLAIFLLLFTLALLIAFGVHAIATKHGSLFGGLAGRPLGTALTAELLLFGLLVVLFFGAIAALCFDLLSSAYPNHRTQILGVLGLGVLVFLFAKPFVLLSNTVFIYAHLRAPSHFAFPSLPFLLASAVSLVIPVWIRAIGERRRTVFAIAVIVLLLLDVSPYRFQEDWTYPDDRVASWRESFARLKGEAPGRILDTHHYNPITDMLAVDAAGRDMAWSWLSWTSTRYVGDIIKTGFFDSMRIARARGDVRKANTQTAAELSALANVRFVSRLASVSPTMPASDAFELVERNEHIELYRNRKTLAYVQFYPERALLKGLAHETVPFVGALAQAGIASFTLDDEELDPALQFDYYRGRGAEPLIGRGATKLNDSPPFRTSLDADRAPNLAPENRAPCEPMKRGSAWIELSCTFDRPGTLVIAEAWFPTWEVRVNGVTRPSLRANHAFQGVAVDSGPAQIRFAHVPSTASRIGIAVSALSWALVLIVWRYYSRKDARAAVPLA